MAEKNEKSVEQQEQELIFKKFRNSQRKLGKSLILLQSATSDDDDAREVAEQLFTKLIKISKVSMAAQKRAEVRIKDIIIDSMLKRKSSNNQVKKKPVADSQRKAIAESMMENLGNKFKEFELMSRVIDAFEHLAETIEKAVETSKQETPVSTNIKVKNTRKIILTQQKAI